jgi:hypothetical protein
MGRFVQYHPITVTSTIVKQNSNILGASHTIHKRLIHYKDIQPLSLQIRDWETGIGRNLAKLETAE